MNIRKKILIFGWITLLIFPIPAFLVKHYFEGVNFSEFIQLKQLKIIPIGYGLEFGIVYAFLCYLIMRSPFFDSVPTRIDQLIGQMNLKISDGLFLSLCAGVGEELLFRAGIQSYLGWIVTSVFFVALHGYLNPWNWRFSIYGLLVLPFILLISYGYYTFGLWFSIAAHFSYDAVLFTIMISEKDDHPNA
jgi:membrane protease YdiL (CAAX protease family)